MIAFTFLVGRLLLLSLFVVMGASFATSSPAFGENYVALAVGVLGGFCAW
jgi:hypothetical protein